MLKKQVAKVCQALVNSLQTPHKIQSVPQDAIHGTGKLIYHLEQRGFFAIVTDDGQDYYPFNYRDFPKLMKDRIRISFTLMPCDTANIYSWGKTVELIDLVQLLDE